MSTIQELGKFLKNNMVVILLTVAYMKAFDFMGECSQPTKEDR